MFDKCSCYASSEKQGLVKQSFTVTSNTLWTRISDPDPVLRRSTMVSWTPLCGFRLLLLSADLHADCLLLENEQVKPALSERGHSVSND